MRPIYENHRKKPTRDTNIGIIYYKIATINIFENRWTEEELSQENLNLENESNANLITKK